MGREGGGRGNRGAGSGGTRPDRTQPQLFQKLNKNILGKPSQGIINEKLTSIISISISLILRLLFVSLC